VHTLTYSTINTVLCLIWYKYFYRR